MKLSVGHPARRIAGRLLLALALTTVAAPGLQARSSADATAIDNYIQPYVDGHKFAGAVLVTRGGDIVFDKAYGYADMARHIENSTATSFHIGALSKAYTAAIAMHLVEKGSLSLDNTVAQFIPCVPNGGRITIRHLLEETSGLPDLTGQPDLLAQHQTAESLAARICALAKSGEPGSFSHEEPSAYQLLARIVELRTGTSFGEALNAFIFDPRFMDGAGTDADDLATDKRYAVGYVGDDAGALKPADTIHWSAKTGDGSVFTTTRDELRFVDALFGDDLLAPETRSVMFDDAKSNFGYGWYIRNDKTLGGTAYSMSGRGYGYAAFVMHVPAVDGTVILLGNIDSSDVARMGQDIAALAFRAP